MTTPTKHDREEFKEFCRNATHSQLYHIRDKERQAADDGDHGREIYAEIAEMEIERRESIP